MVGVAFHVGSGAHDINAFVDAFDDSKIIFDMARSEDIEMHILDIGGGFPGDNNTFFAEIANVINRKVRQNFPPDIQMIAEPGRFLVESCTTLVTRIISAENRLDSMCYFTNEGMYGALNILQYEPEIRPDVLIQFTPNDKRVSGSQKLFI